MKTGDRASVHEADNQIHTCLTTRHLDPTAGTVPKTFQANPEGPIEDTGVPRQSSAHESNATHTQGSLSPAPILFTRDWYIDRLTLEETENPGSWRESNIEGEHDSSLICAERELHKGYTPRNPEPSALKSSLKLRKSFANKKQKQTHKTDDF